ncbi:MAG: ParB/RepB/Spo0J family partition protein, partial [Actinobacteria bacterium]|nr:ParB/RepB/Spo0J family partition protein [Actinomycetota bacterium]
MAQRKRGLGRGLGALIPAAAPAGSGLGTGSATPNGSATPAHAGTGRAEPGGAYFEEIPIGTVTPNPRQPRQSFDEEALGELAASVREVGLLQPIVVRPVMPGRYELVMGERRWRACELAGLDHIPAIVRGTSDDQL